jgi:hypothetical protein
VPINSQHPEYQRTLPQWTRCRDAVEGQDVIKAKGDSYLPRLSGHFEPNTGAQAYEAYKGRALWFGATDRTLNGYVGAILRKDPSFIVPDTLRDRMEDITDAGQNAVQFAHALTKELLTTGRCGLLVDKLSEDASEGEPAFIKLYYPENILNWVVVDGKFMAVILEETVLVPDKDKYDLVEAKQIRELSMETGIYTVTLWRKTTGVTAGSEEWIPGQTVAPTMRGIPIDHIPFVMISADEDSISCSKPPLLDLVNVNINHYQLDADYRHGLHFTALPTPVFTGVDDSRAYYLGSEGAINLRDVNSKAFYLEFNGQGLVAIKDALEDRTKQMAALGAQLLQRSQRGRGVETAEAARIQQSGETSLLSTIVGRIEEGFERALTYIMNWEGVTTAEGDIEVTLNRDFIDATLSAQEITAIVAAWQAGSMRNEDLFWNLQRGGIVKPNITFDEFQKVLDEEKVVKDAAMATRKAAAQPPAPTIGSQDGVPAAGGASGAGGSGAGAGKGPSGTTYND